MSEIVIDLTEDPDWIDEPSDLRLSADPDWDPKERILERYREAIVEYVGCSEQEAQEMMDDFGEEQIWEVRSRALDVCNEEGLWGVERYREVRSAIAVLIHDHDIS